MRVRLFVPLPGPFAITSGRRRPRTNEKIKGGQRGWFFWPTMPVHASFFTAWFWCMVLIAAVVYNLGVLLALAVVVPVQAIRLHRASEDATN